MSAADNSVQSGYVICEACVFVWLCYGADAAHCNAHNALANQALA